MFTNTAQNIINYLFTYQQATSKELADHLGISRQALFRHLPKLLSENKIEKVGKPPVVYYSLKKETDTVESAFKKPIKSPIIENNYLLITPAGEKLTGLEGFSYWCQKNKLPFEKTVKEYAATFNKYARYKKDGLINGMYKMRHTFDKVYTDKIYYLDFYSIERFGKTKLGWLLLYAKQSQNKILIKELCTVIEEKVKKIISLHNINAVCFIPPTIKRDVQLMAEMEKYLQLHLPVIKLQKIKTDLVIPQKTLSKLDDRIENARLTIVPNEGRSFNNILIIDDAVGSGATINETAKKLRERKIALKKIYGLAITGSFKGFEIISEV